MPASRIWLNACLAVLLLFLGRSFGQYLLASATGREFHTHAEWATPDKAGTEVGYFDLEGYAAFSDIGLFCLGIVVISDSLAALPRRRSALVLAIWRLIFLLTLLVALWNVYVTIRLFQIDILPTLTLPATVYGAYLLAQQWPQIRPAHLP